MSPLCAGVAAGRFNVTVCPAVTCSFCCALRFHVGAVFAAVAVMVPVFDGVTAVSFNIDCVNVKVVLFPAAAALTVKLTTAICCGVGCPLLASTGCAKALLKNNPTCAVPGWLMLNIILQLPSVLAVGDTTHPAMFDPGATLVIVITVGSYVIVNWIAYTEAWALLTFTDIVPACPTVTALLLGKIAMLDVAAAAGGGE